MQICKEIAFYEHSNKTTKQLNASVSSILKKMVDDGELQYSTEKGPRGGAIYEINPNNKLAGGYGKKCPHCHRYYLFEYKEEGTEKIFWHCEACKNLFDENKVLASQ
jgi:hypothetical protein